MVKAGYQETDILLVIDAYQLAAKIFNSFYRLSGKTQLAHLIGTASIMTELKKPSASIAAALLHAAYAEGDFGSRSVSKELRNATSPAVQQLVFAYYRLKWPYNPKEIDRLLSSIKMLNSFDREIILLRVVNELEEYIDLAPHYHQGRFVGDEAPTYMDARTLSTFAQVLGEPQLVKEINKQANKVRSAQISAQFRHKYALFNAQKSYRLTIGGRWRRLRRIMRRIQRLGLVETCQAARRRLKCAFILFMHHKNAGKKQAPPASR